MKKSKGKKKHPLNWREVPARLWHKKWLRVIATVITVLLVLFFTARFWNPIIFPPVKQANIGMSFSVKQTQMLGLDWRETYRALLDEKTGMGIKHLRLMSYWDLYEPEQGKMDFTQLDEEIAIAKEYGADVSLAIGLRQPRWPECHEPDWATNMDEKKWQAALLNYIGAVVQRYEKNPTVISWQLENEYYNGLFANCRLATPTRLQTEYDLVRHYSKKPIWMSMSDQFGYTKDMPTVDRYGFSVYRVVYSTGLYNGYMTFPTPIWYHRLRAAIISQTTGKDIFIHELQMEPWAPTDIPYASYKEQDKSMSVNQIRESMLFAREIGAKDMYLWGGEWWYWRQQRGDPSIWNTVREEINKARE